MHLILIVVILFGATGLCSATHNLNHDSACSHTVAHTDNHQTPEDHDEDIPFEGHEKDDCHICFLLGELQAMDRKFSSRRVHFIRSKKLAVINNDVFPAKDAHFASQFAHAPPIV